MAPSAESSSADLAEISSLYEFARGLLGAADARDVAWRAAYAGVAALGVAPVVVFVADDQGRFRRLGAALLSHAPARDALVIPSGTRSWILERGAFPLGEAATARALGKLRDTLAKEYDARFAAAIPDGRELAGLLVCGAELLPGATPPAEPRVLQTLAALTAEALAGHERPRARGTDRGLESVALHARPDPDAAERPAGGPGAGRKWARELERLRASHPALRSLIGHSASLHDACADLVAVAPTRFPVLLTGESGVGKELAARAIHGMSDRAENAFEVVDCASIPAELIESELFGHVRGAFTGAQRDRRGAFELAHRGTLFLDEIGEMPMQLQTRLLRVLQEGRFRRVGDEKLVDVDVRIVAATNRDPAAEVAAKRFRQDLYYRLNVFAVHMPSLRERPEDVTPLIEHFLSLQGRELGVRRWTVDPEVVEALEAYAWPGNIRELVNLCAALVVHTRGTGHVGRVDLAHVWKRQYVGRDAPWHTGARPRRENLGAWVVDQARATRFNLVDLARLLQRQKRSGHGVPIAERSALSYYLTGEILKALAAHHGDPEAAARELAREDDLVARVRSRVEKMASALREAKDEAAARDRFAKLPAGYEEVLLTAWRATTAPKNRTHEPR